MSTFTLRKARQRRKEKEIQQVEQVVEEVAEVVEEEKVEEVAKDVFVCPHCDKEYKTERGLKKHIETKHKDGE